MIGERIKDFDNDHDKRATKVEAYYFSESKSSPSISSLQSIRSRKSLLNKIKSNKKSQKNRAGNKNLPKIQLMKR